MFCWHRNKDPRQRCEFLFTFFKRQHIHSPKKCSWLLSISIIPNSGHMAQLAKDDAIHWLTNEIKYWVVTGFTFSE